jgi:putative autoinducer-2 (AI-2) aldolase
MDEELSNEEITVSLEEAVRLNASAVALSIYISGKYEHQTLVNLAKLIDGAETYGIPVLAVTAVGKELEKRDAKFLTLSCRIAFEMGARIVKTYYCEEFEKVIESCPVPVVIAGGPKLKNEYDVLEMTFQALARGARGVDMGRNIWQCRWPVAMVSAVRAIVHEQFSVEKAFDLFNSLKEKDTAG